MDFRHLVSGAVAELPIATCYYWDDVRRPLSAAEVMSTVDAAFMESGQEPALVDLRLADRDGSKRLSYRSFVRKGANVEIEEVSVYARAPDELAQIWNPPAYAVFRFGERVKFIGIYASSDKVLFAPEDIAQMAAKLDAGAAYRFSYPLAFSPVAYMNGLSFAPNQRSLGTLARRDEIRVLNYRDHCWRGHRAHDGFFRDIYELILMNERAANRSIGPCALVDWIAADQRRGSISKHANHFQWTPGTADARALQETLDAAHILLAGFSPDDHANGI